MKSNIIFSLITFRWVWVPLAIIFAVMVVRLIRILNNYVDYKINESYRAKYDEAEIVGHLDYIIKEALDEYIIFNIQPKNIYYINSEMESRIVENLTEKIPDRLSETLLYNLSIVYSESFIGELIGRRIYMIVLNYVLEFNLTNSPDTNQRTALNAVQKNK